MPCPPCALPRHARREDGSDPPPCARSPLGLGAAGKPPKPGKKPFPGSHHLQASGWDISQSLLQSHCFPMAKAHPALPCHTNPATASRSLLPHPASALPPAPSPPNHPLGVLAACKAVPEPWEEMQSRSQCPGGKLAVPPPACHRGQAAFAEASAAHAGLCLA